MTSVSITSEIQKLAPSAVIELFEVDATSVGAGILRFHAGTNELNTDIVWQGNTYVRFPVRAQGFEITGKGSLPRPKLTVSNYMSSITTLLLAYGDLLGAQVTRKRTFAKHLDAVNFESGLNPSADPTAQFLDDIFFIDRKVNENKYTVEFELTSSFDISGAQLPRRQIIQNACPWVYRGGDCNYSGTNYFTINDEPTPNVAQDVCGKRLKSCKLRFGETNELNFGGFPSADLLR